MFKKTYGKLFCCLIVTMLLLSIPRVVSVGSSDNFTAAINGTNVIFNPPIHFAGAGTLLVSTEAFAVAIGANHEYVNGQIHITYRNTFEVSMIRDVNVRVISSTNIPLGIREHSPIESFAGSPRIVDGYFFVPLGALTRGLQFDDPVIDMQNRRVYITTPRVNMPSVTPTPAPEISTVPNPTPSPTPVPEQSSLIPEFRATISAGGGQSLAIMNDGTLWSWGSNWNGQLGDGTNVNRQAPIRIMEDVVAVSAGAGLGNHSMAIRSDGSLWAWGDNDVGQIGDGNSGWVDGNTTLQQWIPIRVLDNVYAVSAGASYTMAIRTDGSLWAWGLNNQGRLGDGTTTWRSNPVWIMNDVVAVSASPGGTDGQGHTLAIKTDGSLWAWGSNWAGQLGDGTTLDRHLPTHIMDDVIAVSAGGWHTMAIRSDNSLWIWGSNRYGQIGNGQRTEWGIPSPEPVKIMDDVASISAGWQLSMAIRSDGSLYAWGNNWRGRLGDGTTITRVNPVRIMEDVVMVSTNSFHTMAVRSDGSLWSWGWNELGQLGDGTTFNRYYPTKIKDNISLQYQ